MKSNMANGPFSSSKQRRFPKRHWHADGIWREQTRGLAEEELRDFRPVLWGGQEMKTKAAEDPADLAHPAQPDAILAHVNAIHYGDRRFHALRFSCHIACGCCLRSECRGFEEP